MHNAAQLELNAPADKQPMQLEKTWSDVLPWTQLEDQACHSVLYSLKWCDRSLR